MAQDDFVAAAEASGWIVYAEGKENNIELEDWLQKYRPSREELQNFAWISVSAAGRSKKVRNEDDVTKESTEEQDIETQALKLAEDLTERIQAIESDPSIPLRAKKSKGEKSKKDRREEEHAVTANRLKNLAIDSKLTSGKWLFMNVPTENIDALWNKIARAIVPEDGALRGKVFSAKVSPYQPGDGEKPASHVICVYCDDSWNKELVGDVNKILIKDVGVIPGSYKADIYTIAGITSSHPSKMRSTLYGRNDFMKKEEIDAVFEAKKKPAPVVNKKQVKGTGFIESESEDEAEEKQKPKAKKTKT